MTADPQQRALRATVLLLIVLPLLHKELAAQQNITLVNTSFLKSEIIESDSDFNLVRFYSPRGDNVSFHANSGDLSTYSPNGQYLGLKVGASFYVITLKTGACRRVGRAGGSNNHFMWTESNRIARINGDFFQLLDARRLRPSCTIKLRRPRRNGFFALGVSDGSELTTVIFESGGERWISQMNAEKCKLAQQLYRFDEAIHGGLAKGNRWHELVWTGTRYVAGLPSIPYDYSFNAAGGHWLQISRPESEGLEGLASVGVFVHPTYYQNLVLFSTPSIPDTIVAGDFTSGEIICSISLPDTPDYDYHHADLRGDHAVVSTRDNKTGEGRILRINLKDCSYTEVSAWKLQTAEGRSNSFSASARPQINYQGDSICWHTGEFHDGQLDVIYALEAK